MTYETEKIQEWAKQLEINVKVLGGYHATNYLDHKAYFANVIIDGVNAQLMLDLMTGTVELLD